MTGGGIAVGVGGCDDCDAGDALHIEKARFEKARFEMRSQAQRMLQLACEGAEHATDDVDGRLATDLPEWRPGAVF
jgi:hypothetical protein